MYLGKTRILYSDSIMTGRTVVPALQISRLPPVGACWFPESNILICMYHHRIRWYVHNVHDIWKPLAVPVRFIILVLNFELTLISLTFHWKIGFMYNLNLVIYLLNFVTMDNLKAIYNSRKVRLIIVWILFHSHTH